MSFNSKAYLADRERLLEPDTVLIKGTRRRYHEISKDRVMPAPDRRTEQEIEAMEDEFLKQHNI